MSVKDEHRSMSSILQKKKAADKKGDGDKDDEKDAPPHPKRRSALIDFIAKNKKVAA